jgi:hypothetical protein
MTAMNLVIGAQTGGLGQALGGSLIASMAAGAISGALSGAISTPPGGNFGVNILLGSAEGAAGAAVAWGITTSLAPASQASAAEAQGSGETGARQVEKAATAEATSGKAASNGDGGSYAADAERGGAAGAAYARASSRAGQSLTAETVVAASQDQDRYRTVIQWRLAQRSQRGGYIIQSIDTSVDGVRDYQLLEAWRVNPGQTITTYAQTGDIYDDTFNFPFEPGTTGTRTVTARAAYYEGYTLPPAFTPGGARQAGILPSTTNMSIQLPTPTGVGVTRSITINW